jgi:class 3 adenylate cyclase
MPALPTGTLTFLFTDIEGSTRLLHELGAEFYAEALGEHRRVLREAFARHGGVEVDTQGDAFFAVFPSPTEAVASAVEIQGAIVREEWPQASAPRDRIGLHTGEAHIAGEGYVGLDLHRAARIMAAAHGGQILISETTRALVERTLSDGITLRDLGEHRLRDLSRRERLYQVVADGLRTDFPPLRTLDATRNNLPTQPSRGRRSGGRTARDPRAPRLTERAAPDPHGARRHREDATCASGCG